MGTVRYPYFISIQFIFPSSLSFSVFLFSPFRFYSLLFFTVFHFIPLLSSFLSSLPLLSFFLSLNPSLSSFFPPSCFLFFIPSPSFPFPLFQPNWVSMACCQFWSTKLAIWRLSCSLFEHEHEHEHPAYNMSTSTTSRNSYLWSGLMRADYMIMSRL